MMNIKIFQRLFDESEDALQSRIDSWIVENQVDVVDVKISTCFNGVGVVMDLIILYK